MLQMTPDHMRQTRQNQYETRLSATADGPRDALCQSKSCQLLQLQRQEQVVQKIHNKPKWGSYGVTVDRRVVNSHDASTVAGVVNKLDRRRVLLTTRSNRRGEILNA